MKYKLTSRSTDSVQYVFANTDIYHISNLSYHVAAQDVTPEREKASENLRYRWMYDENGFYSSISRYSSFLGRIFEFSQHGDYLRSLRQRINILHILFDCDFNSNLPTHISIAPREDIEGSYVIDFEKDTDYSNFRFIIHPGQTRAQGSVFAKANLKNVLFYVHKDFKDQLQIKQSSTVKKINTIEELLTHYVPVGFDPNTTYEYDFYCPGSSDEFKNGTKHHIANNNTPILKCNGIQSFSSPLQHPGTYYLQDSFWGMDNFCKILFNSKINLYTENKSQAFLNLEKHRKQIEINSLNPILNSPPGKINPEYEGTVRLTYNKDVLPDTNDVRLKLSFINKLSTLFKHSKEILDITNPGLPINFVPNYIQIPSNTTYNKIAELNGYKGFCFYINDNITSKINRDIYELLFCIHPSVSVTKTEKGDIAIINCEHPYWKTGEEYKQWTLPDSFIE